MDNRITELVNDRIQRLEEALGRSVKLPDAPPEGTERLSPEKRKYLLEEAEELYWNELEWENLTEEERLDEGALTELAFPGFLAFIRGLLLEEALPDAKADATPHPEVVADVLRFLGQRAVEFQDELARGADEEEASRFALTMTLRLMDLVLLQLQDLSPEEREEVEAELA